MKRRAYIEILGLGHLKITNGYNTKEFVFNDWKLERNFIDLILLKESKEIGSSLFYCEVGKSWNGSFQVEVCNAQDSFKYMGVVSTNKFNGPNAHNFCCTIIEE